MLLSCFQWMPMKKDWCWTVVCFSLRRCSSDEGSDQEVVIDVQQINQRFAKKEKAALLPENHRDGSSSEPQKRQRMKKLMLMQQS
jgi:hypothetical protein